MQLECCDSFTVMKMIFMKKLGVFVMTYLQLDQTDPDNQY